MGSFQTAGNYRTADPRLVAIAQAAAARSPYNVVLFSGARENNTSSQHYGGNAIDIVLIDPQSGREIPNLGAGGEAFTAYESFARTMRETQQQIAPDLSGNFRWGGYFGPTGLNQTGLDLMHFDLGPTQNMALGTWEGGLNERGRTFVAQAGTGQTYSATQGPGSQRPSSTMAYAPPAGTPAGQGAINAATGPAAGLPAPAPAPGSQRLFRPRSEAIAAREAGGTPRLDELSSIIQQRRAGMNPLLERLQNFIQTRRAARQEDQAPTPPVPIPNTGGGNRAPSSGGGGGGTQSIAQIQQQLADAGFDPGPIDGDMGPRTRAAITAFQRARGLQVDGVAGPQTRAALAAPQAPVPPPNPNPARPGVGPTPPLPPLASGPPLPAPLMAQRQQMLNSAPETALQPTLPGQMPQYGFDQSPLAGVNVPRPMDPDNFDPFISPASPAYQWGAGTMARSVNAYSPTVGAITPEPRISGDGMANRQYTMPTGRMPQAPSPAQQAYLDQTRALETALAQQQAGEPRRRAEQDARMRLGPMLAAPAPSPPPAAPGGVLPAAMPSPMGGPGFGGMPVSTNPTTLVGNTGTPFTREDAVNRGFMPAGRDDFGLQNGFFRDLPGFNAQNPPLVTPQALGQTALRRPVTTTTPIMPNMPLRGMAIPPWWRQFMGTGV